MHKLDFYDFMTDIDVDADFEDRFKLMEQRGEQLGFSHLALGAASPLPVAAPKIFAYSNYSADWQNEYAEKSYFQKDPTVKHGLTSSQALIWDDKLFKKAPDFWESAHSHGIVEGLCQSVRGFDGTTYMLTLSRDHESISRKELEALWMPFSYMLQTTASMLEEAVDFAHKEEKAPELSKREMEVLRWTADGKTAAEISMILNVSERTVSFHINNSLKKLNAVNKTQALVKAVILNLL